MALHKTTTSLLKESLPEFLAVAEYCVGFRKDNGGCLGYPGAAIMFSIVDSLGSYYRDRSDFTVSVDGKSRLIKTGAHHHFFILNSEFYNLGLSETTIKKLYENYRCLLLHNAALARNHFLLLGEPSGPPFVTNHLGVDVNVAGFLRVSRIAVLAFLEKIDQVVPGSNQERIIRLKR